MSSQHGISLGCGWKRQPPVTEGSYEYSSLNNQLQTAGKGWSSSFREIEGVTTPHCK